MNVNDQYGKFELLYKLVKNGSRDISELESYVDKGNETALRFLLKCYYYGHGIEKDLDKFFNYLFDMMAQEKICAYEFMEFVWIENSDYKFEEEIDYLKNHLKDNEYATLVLTNIYLCLKRLDLCSDIIDSSYEHLNYVYYVFGLHFFQLDEIELSANFYELAVEKGVNEGALALNKIYSNPCSPNRNLKKSFIYNLIACQNFEDGDACFDLACDYLFGQGTEIDYKLAYKYAIKAFKLGEKDRSAMILISLLIYHNDVLKIENCLLEMQKYYKYIDLSMVDDVNILIYAVIFMSKRKLKQSFKYEKDYVIHEINEIIDSSLNNSDK